MQKIVEFRRRLQQSATFCKNQKANLAMKVSQKTVVHRSFRFTWLHSRNIKYQGGLTGYYRKIFLEKIPERSKWPSKVAYLWAMSPKVNTIILIILGNATLRGYNSSLRLLSQMIHTLTTLNRCAKNLEDSINIWLGERT